MKFISRLKKWNWTAFWVIILVCCVGALGNKSITNIINCFIMAVIFGIPMGLLWAWMTSDN